MFAHMRSICCNVASLFVGSSCEDENVFGLGFWHVQKGNCSSLRLHIHKPKKHICCFFVWWVAALKMKVCLDWGFGTCKRVFVQACVCPSISQKNLPRVLQKKPAILLHVVTSPDPPAPPWSMLLPNACRHPNRNGCFLFKGLSKQSNVTTLNWGKGGMQVSSQWVWQDGRFFWRTRCQLICKVWPHAKSGKVRCRSNRFGCAVNLQWLSYCSDNQTVVFPMREYL